jgi:hypothetical protein
MATLHCSMAVRKCYMNVNTSTLMSTLNQVESTVPRTGPIMTGEIDTGSNWRGGWAPEPVWAF